MAEVTIYHNPRCSKSRETLRLIRAAGVEPVVVEYLTNPPSVETLDVLCRGLGVEPVDLARRRDPRFRELGLRTEDARSREEWLQLLVDHPALIERPIVVRGSRVVLGRPPERVLDLL